MTATQTFAAALKEQLTEIFKQPVEARLLKLKPGECTGIFSREFYMWRYIMKANHTQFFAELNTIIGASGELMLWGNIGNEIKC